MITMTIKTYSELSTIYDFLDRFNYLKMNGKIGEETFGFDRWLNQKFYTSPEWRALRRFVITRDLGHDLGMSDREIDGKIYVHHMNPISKEDIVNRSEFLLNPEYLICASDSTHKAIHYGDESLLILPPIERTPYDTCPWKLSRR